MLVDERVLVPSHLVRVYTAAAPPCIKYTRTQYATPLYYLVLSQAQFLFYFRAER